VRPVANGNPGLVEGNLSHKSSRERGQSQNAALAVPPADPLKACVTENSLSEMIGHDDPAGLPLDAHEIRFTVFIATNEKSLDNPRNDCTGVCLRGLSNERDASRLHTRLGHPRADVIVWRL
jgi:hypothetical protein